MILHWSLLRGLRQSHYHGRYVAVEDDNVVVDWWDVESSKNSFGFYKNIGFLSRKVKTSYTNSQKKNPSLLCSSFSQYTYTQASSYDSSRACLSYMAASTEHRWQIPEEVTEHRVDKSPKKLRNHGSPCPVHDEKNSNSNPLYCTYVLRHEQSRGMGWISGFQFQQQTSSGFPRRRSCSVARQLAGVHCLPSQRSPFIHPSRLKTNEERGPSLEAGA